MRTKLQLALGILLTLGLYQAATAGLARLGDQTVNAACQVPPTTNTSEP